MCKQGKKARDITTALEKKTGKYFNIANVYNYARRYYPIHTEPVFWTKERVDQIIEMIKKSTTDWQSVLEVIRKKYNRKVDDSHLRRRIDFFYGRGYTAKLVKKYFTGDFHYMTNRMREIVKLAENSNSRGDFVSRFRKLVKRDNLTEKQISAVLYYYRDRIWSRIGTSNPLVREGVLRSNLGIDWRTLARKYPNVFRDATKTKEVQKNLKDQLGLEASISAIKSALSSYSEIKSMLGESTINKLLRQNRKETVCQ